MLTIISYLGLLISFLTITLIVYISLIKIKLI
uniref:Cytochrome b6-f complex subunit 6 n=1 Tax=Koliella corcontica TaxID=155904 RepID=A0A097KMT6_9CHLO|nr:subunit VI of cytochrome b6/f complex [Koliella corcontica]AIT94485.1 subunit VI of cytochrome b6/f complex [Koliella corcontica]